MHGRRLVRLGGGAQANNEVPEHHFAIRPQGIRCAIQGVGQGAALSQESLDHPQAAQDVFRHAQAKFLPAIGQRAHIEQPAGKRKHHRHNAAHEQSAQKPARHPGQAAENDLVESQAGAGLAGEFVRVKTAFRWGDTQAFSHRCFICIAPPTDGNWNGCQRQRADDCDHDHS